MKESIIPIHEANDLISYKESKISELKIELNSLENEFKAAESMYNEAKAKVDTKRQQVNDAEQSLTILVGLRNGDLDLGKLKIYQKISNTIVKPKERNKKEFKWVKEAEILLDSQQKFMKPENLISSIFLRNVGWKNRLEQRYKTPSKTNAYVEKVRERLKTNKRFTIYQNKIGLSEWLDGSGRPKEKFIKTLMS